MIRSLGDITPIYNVYSGVQNLPPVLTAQQIVQPLPDATAQPAPCGPLGTLSGLQCFITEHPVVSLAILLGGIYALGRGTEYYDMPLIRSIVHEAAKTNYRFSSLVLGIVKSDPFQMNQKVQVASNAPEKRLTASR